MLKECTSFRQIFIACGRTDLRKGIDGLATLVSQQFHLDPFQKDVLFLFCGCRQDRFKGLVWEGDGFVLIYKRIEAGSPSVAAHAGRGRCNHAGRTSDSSERICDPAEVNNTGHGVHASRLKPCTKQRNFEAV